MSEIIRTYVDANVIINAFRGKTDELVQIAINILEDPSRIILFSDFLRLEVLAKPVAFQKTFEVEFINEILSRAEYIPFSPDIPQKAWQLASAYGLGAVDALHLASAHLGRADEFLSFEKPTKPFYKVSGEGILIRSLLPLL